MLEHLKWLKKGAPKSNAEDSVPIKVRKECLARHKNMFVRQIAIFEIKIGNSIRIVLLRYLCYDIPPHLLNSGPRYFIARSEDKVSSSQ